ncbi:Cyclic di-GMP phosphodiesterase Gmr [Thiorhodovibrio winogradskyi]|uniref:Cyclic di-GMP phosphodiesterase Gmr n=1 Tax=Thiorhodovibrio winogradskyi TaxID=77007 RepID=A0ABZ0S6T2_9GAMM|nr:PAS domain S-box protein [Thiorhodovibrio winogradskyi]
MKQCLAREPDATPPERSLAHSLAWEYWLDAEGGLREVSSVCEEISGYAAGDFLADPDLWLGILTPDSRQRWSDQLRAQTMSGATSPQTAIELALIISDGQQRWIEHRCQPVFAPDGCLQGWRGLILDITARKKAELALAREKGLARTISAFNQALIQTGDLDALLATLCRLVVETGGLRACMIFRWSEPEQKLEPLVWSGLGEDSVARMPRAMAASDHLSAAAPLRAWCGECAVFCHDRAAPACDAPFDLWLQSLGVQASSHQLYRAGGEQADAPLGVVSYLLADDLALDREYCELLGQLTADLSFGIGYLKRRAHEARMQADITRRKVRLDALFQSSPVGVALIRERRIIEANDRLCELTGYAREELIDHSTRLLYVSEQAFAANGEALYPRLQSCGEARVETQLRRKDGEILEVTLCLSLLDPAAPDQGSISTVLDMTESRRDRALLETRLALAKHSREGDLEAIRKTAAEAAKRITTSREAEVRLLDHEQAPVVWSELEADALPLWREAARTNTPLVRNESKPAKGGSRVAVPLTQQGQVVAVLEVAGKEADYGEADLLRLQQLASMAVESIEIIHAAQALRAGEERYRIAIQAARDGIWDWDIRAGRVDVNARYLTMLGFLPEPAWLSFSRWRGLVHPEDLERMLRVVESSKSADQPFEAEYRLQHQSGRWHWVFARGRVIERDAQGTAVRMAGIHIDIDARKQAELAAREARQWLEVALAGGEMGLYEVDLIEGSGRVDAHYLRMLGYAPGEIVMDVSTWQALMHPEDRERMNALVAEMVDGQLDQAETEYRMRHRAGGWRWILDRSRVYSRDQQGRAVRSGGIHLDITKRKATEERLRLAAQVFESISEGIVVTDLSGKILDVNQAFVTITGYPLAEVKGQTPALLRSGRHDDHFYAKLWRQLEQSRFWQGEIWNRRKNGEIYPEWLTISAVVDDHGQATHYVGVFADITSLRQSQDRLDFLAHHDPLTGLPNRALLLDRLEVAVVRARRESRAVAVLFIDLDGFKRVNDNLGHATGDKLLVEVAERMRSRLRRGDTLGRLGGDEFLMLLEQDVEEGSAVTLAKLLLEILAEPIVVDEHEIFVSGSIGISLFPQDGEDAEALLAHADLAMYQAKALGRGRHAFYEPELSHKAERQFGIERALRGALLRGDFFLLYQPQVSLSDGSLLGVEALLRWRHPELGVMEPAQFLPAAERFGLMAEIGRWVLFEAANQLRQWRKVGVAVPKLAVNGCLSELSHADFLPVLHEVLDANSLAPEDLVIELVGRIFLDRGDRVQSNLKALRELGVRLAIDNFGIDSGNLADLARLRVDCLKIDRSLTAAAAEDGRVTSVCRSIFGLGKALRLEVVAEGIERRSQAQLLRRHGCTAAQGWLFAEPFMGAQLSEWEGAGASFLALINRD